MSEKLLIINLHFPKRALLNMLTWWTTSADGAAVFVMLESVLAVHSAYIWATLPFACPTYSQAGRLAGEAVPVSKATAVNEFLAHARLFVIEPTWHDHSAWTWRGGQIAEGRPTSCKG